MSDDDLWERAAACVQAAHATRDLKRRAVLTGLGNFWIGLIHNKSNQIDDAMALSICEIERIQTELIGTQPTFH